MGAVSIAASDLQRLHCARVTTSTSHRYTLGISWVCTVVYWGGGIQAQIGTCSTNETFQYECFLHVLMKAAPICGWTIEIAIVEAWPSYIAQWDTIILMVHERYCPIGGDTEFCALSLINPSPEPCILEPIHNRNHLPLQPWALSWTLDPRPLNN